MFDFGVARMIEGVDIDRPFNALSLSPEYHRLFGAFDVFFTMIPDGPPHTYRIESLEHDGMPTLIPVTRTLALSPNRNIDPPSSRLLAVHRAIAHILQLSDAGAYIDKFLRDMDDGFVRSDGSTPLDRFVKLRLGNKEDCGVH